MERASEEGTSVGAQVSVWFRGGAATLVSGLAAPGRAMAGDTLLPWFSVTKVLVALSVMQQWERGRLDPDDPVAAHVPEFGANGKERVTLRHLLTHTARLAAPVGDESWPGLLATACASPLAEGWEPGRRAAYSPRLGYSVLGEVVRRLDGRPLDACVSEDVLEPLGMGDSWLALPPGRYEAYGERMGVMYDTAREGSGPIPALARASGFEGTRPSSSAVGPSGDLVRLFVALLGKGELDGARVLSPQGVDTMCARHRSGLEDETFGEHVDWGLGVIVNSWHYRRRPAPYGFGDHASPRTFGHGGNRSSVAFADPDAGLAAAVIFNGMAGEARHHRRTRRVVNAIYADLGLAG